jgi:DNA-binding XRE family transcriptional regulator
MGNAAVRAKGRGARALYVTVAGPARRHRARLPKDDAKDAAPHDRTGAETCERTVAVRKTIPFSEISDAWKRDPAFRVEYESIGPMELAFALAEARRDAGLTQAEVSRLMGTSQAAVARLESGRAKPTWETVERFARAVGRRAVVKLEPVE